MQRTTRLAVLGAVTLLIAIAGTVLASRAQAPPNGPSVLAQDGHEAPPTAEDLAHAAERLRAHGVTVDDAQLADLASRYGIGGAVRVLAWAADPDDDITIESITTMRDGDGTPESVMGWGRIAKTLGVHSGLGSIMGNGGGQVRQTAPGQQQDAP
jgi:hypothetical protein